MPLAVDITPLNFFSRTTFHPVWTVVIVLAAAWYLLAVRRLEARGGYWPRYRTWLYLSALLLIAGGTLSGLTSWDHTNFTLPIIQRVMLGLAAPVPLIVSAPGHLALEAGSPLTQRLVRRFVDSWVARFLAYPLTAFVISGGWIVLVYFTGLYGVSVRHDSVAALLDVGFIVTGVLFYYPVMGEDLPPRVMPHPVRAVYLLLNMILGTLLGMALESQNSVPVRGFSLNDVHTGGGIMWTSGEFIDIVAAIAVLVVWFKIEETSARSHDETDVAEAAEAAEAWRAERRLAAAHAAAVRAGILAEAGAAEAAAAVAGTRRRARRANTVGPDRAGS